MMMSDCLRFTMRSGKYAAGKGKPANGIWTTHACSCAFTMSLTIGNWAVKCCACTPSSSACIADASRQNITVRTEALLDAARACKHCPVHTRASPWYQPKVQPALRP